MEAPYFLHKLADASKPLRVFAAPAQLNSKKSSNGLVVATDSQGLNIFHLQTGQILTSYSLSPATKFLCAPVCRYDDLSRTRQTIAAFVSGRDPPQVCRWTETGTEATVQTLRIQDGLHSIHAFASHLLLVYEGGKIGQTSDNLGSLIHQLDLTMTASQSEAYTRQKVLAAGIFQGQLHCVLAGGEYLEIQIIELSGAEPFVSVRTAISIRDRLMAIVPSISASFNISGQLALGVKTSDGAKVFLINQDHSTIGSYHVEPSSASKTFLNPQVVWLNKTTLLTSLDIAVGLWSLPYMTCQAHTVLPIFSKTLTSIATTSRSRDATDVSIIFQRENSLYICRSTVSRADNLSKSIGKNHTSSLLAASWLEDISLQSTWKNTENCVDENAETCLRDLEVAKSGLQFDQIVAAYLKVDLLETAETHQAKGRYLKDNLTISRTKLARERDQVIMSEQSQTSVVNPSNLLEGENSTSDSALQLSHGYVPHITSETESTQLELEFAEELRNAGAHRKYQSPTSEVTKLLSATFVERLIGLVFLKLPAHLSGDSARGTIGYLFRKRLVRLAEGCQADKILNFMVQHKSPWRISFMQASVELLPDQLLLLLKSFFGEGELFREALSSALPRLAEFDFKLVHDALHLILVPSEISLVLQILQNDLKARVTEPPVADCLSISEDVLCTSITRFLDALGYSSAVLSSTSSQDVGELKNCTASLIRETEQVNLTASQIAQFLMKCRALDMVKANNKARAKNIVQQANLPAGSTKLERLKDSTEGTSARAKAYARVVGVGSAYTIETIQI